MGKQVGNVQLMQKMNRLKVLNLVRRNQDIARPAIAEQTGLSLSSITNITAYLLEEGLLEECGTEPAERVGRKSTLLRFRTEAYGLVIASLNENRAEVSYTDLEGKIQSYDTVEIVGLSPERVITRLEEHINTLLDKYGKENTLAIGVIFSGLVLDGSRFVLSSSMKWKKVDIKKSLEADTGLPVYVENISRSKAIWYSSTHDRDEKNMLFVDLENGIGAVQVCRGAINRSLLGEIGHTTVEKDGEPCFCGNKGCLEAMCSVNRLIRLYEEQSGTKDVTLTEIAQRYELCDKAARYAVNDCATYLGIGLANLIMMSHPAVLVLNASDFAECPMLITEAMEECKRRAYLALTKELKICRVMVGREEALKGAAVELCDRLFDLGSAYNPVQ